MKFYELNTISNQFTPSKNFRSPKETLQKRWWGVEEPQNVNEAFEQHELLEHWIWPGPSTLICQTREKEIGASCVTIYKDII